jgi:acetyl-CoA carboxylase carboxyl transferase subunit beta
MSWLNKVRQNLPFLPKRTTPDNLWHKCRECGALVFVKEYEENASVCPRCEHHGRIGPHTRFDLLFDAGTMKLIPAPAVARTRSGFATRSAMSTGCAPRARQRASRTR